MLQDLGLEVSQKNLVPPSTQVVCLVILINTVDNTISIPQEILQEIKNMCTEFKSEKCCTKTQLQSFLGTLLYITKCVHPARYSLNKMLQVLRDNTEQFCLVLTHSFHQDFNCFFHFLKSV